LKAAGEQNRKDNRKVAKSAKNQKPEKARIFATDINQMHTDKNFFSYLCESDFISVANIAFRISSRLRG